MGAFAQPTRFSFVVLTSLVLAACATFQRDDVSGQQLEAPASDEVVEAAPAEPEVRPVPIPRDKPGTVPMPASEAQLKRIELELDDLMGMTADEMETLLGPPDAIEDKPPSLLWIYKGPACALQVLFFPEVESGQLYSLQYNVSRVGEGPEEDADAASCAQELVGRRQMNQMSPAQTHAKLVIVDDDSLFRESVQENLSDFGYQTTAFSNGPEALDYLRSHADIDLILLDWKMPQMTGIEVLEALRKGENETPVIFLTVLGDQIYEEAALHGGAVDFVEKSRSFSILLRRIQLILGGTKTGEGKEDAKDAKQAPAKIGDLRLHRQSGRAEWKGDEVALTLTEFRIVDLIAGRQGRDVRYREIYDVVHGEHFVAGSGESGYRANVRSAIKRIRHKFRMIDPEFEAIENYPGFGYRWRA